MIICNEEPCGATSLREWASLFSGKYFAMLVVFADETGTGGIQKGREPAPGVCGFVATPEMWENFRTSWKTMLKKHKDASYFHFRELGASERKKSSNPYHGWDEFEVDDFIYDMAIVASSGPIPFGGNVSVKKVYGKNPTKENLNERYKSAFEQFFYDFGIQMDNHFPEEKAPVTFFFDENKNEEWIGILNKVIKESRKKDHRIAEWMPIDDKTERGMPCQAADLFAYVNRQNNEVVYDRDMYVPQRVLDIILARHGFPRWHPFRALREMSDHQWENLVAELRGSKKVFDMENFLSGNTDKPQYYPIIHHPYFQYLSTLCEDHKRKNRNLWI